MAKRKPRKGGVPEDMNLSEAPLFGYMKKAYRTYGQYTLEQRAVADFRDGLKPVQRRVLWSANGLGLSGQKGVSSKSAKIVGECMGNYHPHGDSAIYETLVNLTRSCVPSMIGIGNFGSQLDSAASSRYTEAHLSQFADLVFFDKRYLHVMETAENYDGTRREPLVLPALLPNLLLNGAYGIAVGATSSVPAFDLDGVVELTKMAVAGEDVTLDLCMDHMEPVSPREAWPSWRTRRARPISGGSSIAGTAPCTGILKRT